MDLTKRSSPLAIQLFAEQRATRIFRPGLAGPQIRAAPERNVRAKTGANLRNSVQAYISSRRRIGAKYSKDDPREHSCRFAALPIGKPSLVSQNLDRNGVVQVQGIVADTRYPRFPGLFLIILLLSSRRTRHVFSRDTSQTGHCSSTTEGPC